MTKTPTQFECCLGIILSLYGYSPKGFKGILNEKTYKGIKVNPGNPFSQLYNKLDTTYSRITHEKTKKDLWKYLKKKKDLTSELSKQDDTNNVSKLIGLLNLLANHNEKFKSECLNSLQNSNNLTPAILSFSKTSKKRTYQIGNTCLSQLLDEFEKKYSALNNDEFQLFHSDLKYLWDDEYDEILEKIEKKELIEFEKEQVNITIKFSEFYCGCEKRIFLRVRDKMRIFKIQIEPRDVNLDKVVDGCQFNIEVDNESKFDIDDDGISMLYYFDDNDKVGQTIPLYTGKNILLNKSDLINDATRVLFTGDKLEFEEMPQRISIHFIDVKKKIKPAVLNVNQWRGSKKDKKTPTAPSVKKTSQPVDKNFMITQNITGFPKKTTQSVNKDVEIGQEFSDSSDQISYENHDDNNRPTTRKRKKAKV